MIDTFITHTVAVALVAFPCRYHLDNGEVAIVEHIAIEEILLRASEHT